jgi:parallel beta-helix repeat protein
MTVRATVDSTLNGQQATLIVREIAPDGSSRTDQQSLSGGSESFLLTGLQGGRDKEYYSTVELETSDVTQTAQVPYGLSVELDPEPFRDLDDAARLRGDETNFPEGLSVSNGVGLGSNPLTHGLLTTALSEGEVLADDGYVYSSIQSAENAASNWLFIGPGTFNEEVTVTTTGLNMTGTGRSTTIYGEQSTDFTAALKIESSDVTVSNMDVETLVDGNVTRYAVYTTGSDSVIDSVRVPNADGDGFRINSTGSVVSNCRVDQNNQNINIRLINDRTRCINSVSLNANSNGIVGIGAEHIIANCVSVGNNGSGITLNDGFDSIVLNNRVHSNGSHGIDMFSGADCIIANNRVSSNSSTDISDQGTNTVLDSNLTGAAN